MPSAVARRCHAAQSHERLAHESGLERRPANVLCSGSEPVTVTDDAPPRPASLPPGHDDEDPYEDEALSAYPDWWRANVEEFRAHGMRPYRPPRLADGDLSPPVLADLRETFGVDVRFRARNPQSGGAWALVVDGEPVRTVEHHRHGDGYTVYGLTSEELARAVRTAVEN